jgi:hypothetical protein
MDTTDMNQIDREAVRGFLIEQFATHLAAAVARGDFTHREAEVARMAFPSSLALHQATEAELARLAAMADEEPPRVH